jgi:hypothetical protein
MDHHSPADDEILRIGKVLLLIVVCALVVGAFSLLFLIVEARG